MIELDHSAPNRKSRKRSGQNALIAATVAVVFVVVVVSWARFHVGGSDPLPDASMPGADVPGPDDRITTAGQTSLPRDRATDAGSRGDVAAQRSSRNDVAADDGPLLWTSPTDGRPLTLQYVPTSAKFYLCARPAEWWAHAEGPRALRALGPTFSRHMARWEKLAGLPLSEIERLTLAWAPSQGRMPDGISVIWTAAPLTLPSAATSAHDGKTYVMVGDLAKYQPSSQAGRVTVMGSVGLVREVMEQGDAAPLLRREVDRLRQVSDDSRQLNLLFTPNFVYYDGRSLFGSHIGRLLDPLEEFLGDRIHAGLISVHLGSGHDLYGELRLLGRGDDQPVETTAQLRDRLARVPREVGDFVSRQGADDYSRRIIDRFGKMMVYCHDRLRYDTQRGQTIVNFIVPSVAAHNVLLASELTLASSFDDNPIGGTPVEAVLRHPVMPTLSQTLQRRTTLEFGQRSLEASLEELESQVRERYPQGVGGFRIKILGRDLQMEGITRNQQVKKFRQSNKTVAQILTAIVMTANPVTTVGDPSEIDQKLVWCVITDPQRPTEQVVAVTTRKAAGDKGYDLPEEFRRK